MRSLRRFLRDECGSELVEFAASALVLLTLLFGIMEGSRALYINHFLANAAREGSRYAMSRGHAWAGHSCTSTSTFACEATATDVSAFVKSIASGGIDPSAIHAVATWPGTDVTGASCLLNGATANSAGCVVQVRLSYTFSFVLPLLPQNAIVMSSASAVTIAQ